MGPHSLTSWGVVYEIQVHDRGPSDIVIDDAEDAEKHPIRPRIELPAHLRVLTDPWCPGGLTPDADVRVSRALRGDDQHLHLHVHRIAARATARVRVVCTYRDDATIPDDLARAIAFYPGFYAGVDIESAGLLARDSARLPRA